MDNYREMLRNNEIPLNRELIQEISGGVRDGSELALVRAIYLSSLLDPNGHRDIPDDDLTYDMLFWDAIINQIPESKLMVSHLVTRYVLDGLGYYKKMEESIEDLNIGINERIKNASLSRHQIIFIVKKINQTKLVDRGLSDYFFSEYKAEDEEILPFICKKLSQNLWFWFRIGHQYYDFTYNNLDNTIVATSKYIPNEGGFFSYQEPDIQKSTSPIKIGIKTKNSYHIYLIEKRHRTQISNNDYFRYILKCNCQVLWNSPWYPREILGAAIHHWDISNYEGLDKIASLISNRLRFVGLSKSNFGVEYLTINNDNVYYS